jgi:1-acyl-sn-glycerol-3-phosphate acyltransferase
MEIVWRWVRLKNERDDAGQPSGNDRVSAFITRLIRILVAVLLWPLFLPKAEGNREEPSDEGCILISNHQHLIDAIFITYFYPTKRLCFVAKKELFQMMLVGRIIKAFGAIPLDRSSTDIRASKLILSEIKKGKIIGVFIQGTRVKLKDAASVAPHSSILNYAIRRGIPVIPVAVDPCYRPFGRPRYIFGDALRLTLKKGESIDREEQDQIAREVMRRIYAMADRSYEFEGADQCQALFDEKILVSPLKEISIQTSNIDKENQPGEV